MITSRNSTTCEEEERDAGSLIVDFLDEISSSDDESDEVEWNIEWKLVCNELFEKGFSVIENVTQSEKAKMLHDEVEALHEACLLSPSPNGLALNEKKRAILNKRGVGEMDWHLSARPVTSTPAHIAARKLCPRLRCFAGGAASSMARNLGRFLNALLYVDEVKAQFQEEIGSCFPAHFDTSPESVRIITAILYLNPDWETGDGGELRFLPLARGPIDIKPLFNRLVLFSSTTMLHRTLPSYAPRRCISFWFGAGPNDHHALCSTLPIRSKPCLHCFTSKEEDMFSPSGRVIQGKFINNGKDSLNTFRTLTLLYHCYEYRDSFLAAFDHVPDLHLALAHDDSRSAAARAALSCAACNFLDNRVCSCHVVL